jgi:hypothetical protein
VFLFDGSTGSQSEGVSYRLTRGAGGGGGRAGMAEENKNVHKRANDYEKKKSGSKWQKAKRNTKRNNYGLNSRNI